MQAIELETAIVEGEIHAKLPTDISVEKVRLIVLYETPPLPEYETTSGLLQLLDSITSQRDWPDKSKAEIDSLLDTERSDASLI
ncbi:MAG: hypothetical protein ABSB19_07820 [Methylomonas sp.]|jgi:hypothetical protein